MSALPKNLVTLYDAGEELNINPCTFYNAENRKYDDYIYDVSGKKMFDVEGYRHFEALKEELLEKTKLFTEYLFHEEGFTYTEIANSVGITHQVLSKVNYGFETAFKILKWFKANNRYAIERFDIYYGWSK